MSATQACTASLSEPGIPASPRQNQPQQWLVVAAFAAVYLVWGSTYLAIHFAVETLPPFLMAGARFVLAGAMLYAGSRFLGAERPQGIHWRSSWIIGGLLLLIGNGAISWVQQRTPTNITALMVAATPLWMNIVEWLRPGGRRPGGFVPVGLLMGFVGVSIIVLSRVGGHGGETTPLALAVLLGAPLCWAIGSIYSRHAVQTVSPLLNISMQMLCGGALMLLFGYGRGELTGFHFSQVSAVSAVAFVYLTMVGSLVGFTAYAWLLQVSTPARVSTYAYVNPLIAVILGHAVLGETFPSSLAFASCLILGAVILITATRGK